MVDRAEEIAQALNKVHICNLSSAVSAETWQELIEDYFVHDNAEDSDNELTDDSGDESIDVVERLPEDDERGREQCVFENSEEHARVSVSIDHNPAYEVMLNKDDDSRIKSQKKTRRGRVQSGKRINNNSDYHYY